MHLIKTIVLVSLIGTFAVGLAATTAAPRHSSCDMYLNWIGGVLPVPYCSGTCNCAKFNWSDGSGSHMQCVCYDQDGNPYSMNDWLCTQTWTTPENPLDPPRLDCHRNDCSHDCHRYPIEQGEQPNWPAGASVCEC
jgi:hypothetical protein